MQIFSYCRVPAVVLVGVLIPALTLGQTTQARPEPTRQSEDAELRQELDRLAELMSRSLSDRAAQWQCRPVARNDCGPDGCAEGEPTVWVTLDFDSRRYERCDQSGCDDYQMEVHPSGIYPGFPIWLWYRIARTKRRALISGART